MDSPKASLKESKHNMVEPAHEHDEPSSSQQSAKDPMRIDTIMIDATDRGEEQQQQKDNNDTSMTDEAVAEDQVESESSITKRPTKSLSRKTRQKKQQQGSSSKVTGKRRTSKRKQQPEPSPEPSLPSGVDQSPVLEYVGKDFEPVLPLPKVGDDNVDNTPLFGPPPTEHDTTNDERHQSDAAAPSQHDTMNTQQSEGVDTQQTNQQDDIQSNVPAPSQHDIVDTQQSEGVDTQQTISMDHQQSQEPEPKKKRQTRKRRRLVDPKKRMIEDYEGDLSPLARVNRIVLQNDEQ